MHQGATRGGKKRAAWDALGRRPTIRQLADRKDIPTDRTPFEAVSRLSSDISAFKRRHRLEHVVVINVASSEPPHRSVRLKSYEQLCKNLKKRGDDALSTSSLYALAAIEAKCPFVNFTPSTGININVLRERADSLGIPYMGNDGKTGESLVKSFLAPMSSLRNLSVLSWVGQNILGNRDGHVLSDPATRRTKVRSKDKLLSELKNEGITTRVSIDYVPSLGDWKVAWDFIHFEGFLGTKMNMQFTWQGSDSALAAPLVIDLTRFAVHEARGGRGGPMHHLACFFKNPIGVNESGYFDKWQRLLHHMDDTNSGKRRKNRKSHAKTK